MKIYQIEIANYCNLSCKYCPYPNQSRLRGFMSIDTFKKVLLLARKCNQNKIYLHNFGEPLLHPQLEIFIEEAAKNGIECSFYTNGILMKREKIDSLYRAGLRSISISNHVSEISKKVIEEIKYSKYELVIEDIYNPTFIHDWCGQVDYKGCTHICSKSASPCIFERENAFVILWNGDIASCCLDCDGISSKINIDNLLVSEYTFQRYELCDRCDLMRGEESL